MQAHGILKKWVVDNKLDKDGCPDPKITMTIEIPFLSYRAKALADITTGDALSFKIEKTQTDIPFTPADGDVVHDQKADPPVPLLLNDSPGESEAETEDGESAEMAAEA